MPEIRFTDATLRQAVEFVAEMSGRHIVFDWRGVEAAGVDAEARIALWKRDITVAQALDALLGETGANAKGIRHEPAGEMVLVSTASRIAAARRLLAHRAVPVTAPTRPGTKDPLRARLAVVEPGICIGDLFGLGLRGRTLREALAELSEHTSGPTGPRSVRSASPRTRRWISIWQTATWRRLS